MKRTHLTERLEKLKSEGYTMDLRFEEQQLIDTGTNHIFKSEDIEEVKEYRFEGMNDPGDASILFAISFTNGSKGTLSAVYGPRADAALFEFIAKSE